MSNSNNDNLSNWNSNLGESPYIYGSEYPKNDYTPFLWKFSKNSEEQEEINKIAFSETKYKGKVLMTMDLWDLHLINNINITFLISPSEFINNKNEREADYNKFNRLINNLLSEDNPVQIHIGYPFSKEIELTVYPIVQTSYTGNLYSFYTMGYLAWQVSMLYAEIYKNHEKEAGIWGHSFSDLHLSYFRIFENNKILIDVDS